MKYKGTLIVVKDCKSALKFYQDLFGFELIQDNDGNMVTVKPTLLYNRRKADKGQR